MWFHAPPSTKKLHGPVTALLSAILLVVSAGIANASSVDESIVDTTAPTGTVTLAAGGSGAITINLSVAGNQVGTATFQVNRDWTLSGGVFSGSNPQTFTVPPRAASDPATTFSTTGTVTVGSSQANGTFTLSVGAFDITNSNQQGAKLGPGASSNYQVTVSTPADSTPPIITPSVSGTLGNNGWYTSDVTVTFSVTDAESTITSESAACSATNTVTGDTLGVTFTCTATSAGGAASKSVTIKRDATPPSLTGTPNIPANLAGWNDSGVTIHYVCSDAMSGLAGTCPADDVFTTGGTYVWSHTIYDNAGNAATVSGTVEIDLTAPTIAGTTDRAANGSGWYDTPVTVTFTCGDLGGSGLATCSDPVTLASDGAGQSVTGQATDNAGNSSSTTVSGINIDQVAPSITFQGATGTLGNRGWYTSNVTLTWKCTDALSGAVDATVTQTLSGDGANQSATGTCEDLAGNTASDTQSGINIDQTAPVITFASRAPAANANGWNNADVTVTWTCTDAVSGPVHDSVSQATTTEGSNLSLTGTCEDLAGNTASDTYSGINVDKTAPTASASASPASNANGWNNSAVTVSFNGTDGLSGIDFCDAAVALSTEGAGQTASGTCTDKAGNVSLPATASGINIDETTPTVALVGGPQDGQTYYFGFVPAAPTCTASDALSGIDGSCGITGYSNAIGSHTVTASATDKAGNGASTSATYAVSPWSLTGFYAPLDPNPNVWNTVKGGSTVPLKFNIYVGLTMLTDTSDVQSFTAVSTSCPGSSASTDPVDFTTTGGTSLRWDSTAQQFVQNWQTPKKPGTCVKVTMTTLDSSSLVGLFILK